MSRNERLVRHYNLLRSVGFNRVDANKLKFYSSEKVSEIVSQVAQLPKEPTVFHKVNQAKVIAIVDSVIGFKP